LKRFDRSGSKILLKWLDEPNQRRMLCPSLSKPIPFEMGMQVPRGIRVLNRFGGSVR
jgi:hypothetical protein